jgi:uncharacterized membrane protein YccC
MIVGLYAAFWLQLESASSAAVTVAIPALQTRGQNYQTAIYWLLATASGIVASFVIAGLFAQARDLLVIGFAGWLGLDVGALLDGNRAFGATLSGYTVAQVAVTQIDLPQNIFLAGVNRGAALTGSTRRRKQSSRALTHILSPRSILARPTASPGAPMSPTEAGGRASCASTMR